MSDERQATTPPAAEPKADARDGDWLDEQVYDHVLENPWISRADVAVYVKSLGDAHDGRPFNDADVSESIVEMLSDGRLVLGKDGEHLDTGETGCEDPGPDEMELPARPSTAPPIRAGQAAFNVLNLLDHNKANALRGTDADPFYDDAKLPKFWEALGRAPATIVEEGPRAEGGRPAAADDVLTRGLIAGDSMIRPIRDFQLRAAVILRDEQDQPLPDNRTIPVPGCPCCDDLDAFDLASHMCGGCHRFVCGDCKVDAAGEPSPCHGICKDCRAKGLDGGTLAVRSLKRIQAELEAGVVRGDDPSAPEIEQLARSILHMAIRLIPS